MVESVSLNGWFPTSFAICLVKELVELQSANRTFMKLALVDFTPSPVPHLAREIEDEERGRNLE